MDSGSEVRSSWAFQVPDCRRCTIYLPTSGNSPVNYKGERELSAQSVQQWTLRPLAAAPQLEVTSKVCKKQDTRLNPSFGFSPSYPLLPLAYFSNFTSLLLFFFFLFSFSGNMGPDALAAAAISNPVTGYDGRKEAPFIWLVSPAPPANVSCRQERNVACWRTGSSADPTMTWWWKTLNVPRKVVCSQRFNMKNRLLIFFFCLIRGWNFNQEYLVVVLLCM